MSQRHACRGQGRAFDFQEAVLPDQAVRRRAEPGQGRVDDEPSFLDQGTAQGLVIGDRRRFVPDAPLRMPIVLRFLPAQNLPPRLLPRTIGVQAKAGGGDAGGDLALPSPEPFVTQLPSHYHLLNLMGYQGRQFFRQIVLAGQLPDHPFYPSHRLPAMGLPVSSFLPDCPCRRTVALS